MAFLIFFLCIWISSTGYGITEQDLQRQKAVLADYETHSKMWQWGWTGVFVSSISLQGHQILNKNSTADEKFDAKIGLLTSSSGLLSMIVNPLPLAFTEDWYSLPEASEKEKDAKYLLGKKIFSDSYIELQRRHSFSFQMKLVAEQLVAASLIALLDKRPSDAGKRFLLGMITSELWIYTLPGAIYNSNDLNQRLQMRLSGSTLSLTLQF